jgi:peroxiredoxin
MEQQDALKEVGVEEVIIYCVNDGAVMMAWAKDQGVTDEGMISLMGDPYGDLTVALQMELTHPGPASVGITGRCKRFALYIEDGVVQIVRVAESENDPAGDEFPDVTLAESMVQAIQEFQAASIKHQQDQEGEL